MTKVAPDKLAGLVTAVRALPAPSQDLLVQELQERVAELTESHLSDAQRTEVKRRLALPRRHASDDDVRMLLHKYNHGL